MGMLDKLFFLMPRRSDAGRVLDAVEEGTESSATIDDDLGQKEAAFPDEVGNVSVLCAYEHGNLTLRFASEDKLMHLMGEPANDDGQNRVP